MLNRFYSLVIGGALVLTLGACATPGSQSTAQPGAMEIRQGVIEQITPTRRYLTTTMPGSVQWSVAWRASASGA